MYELLKGGWMMIPLALCSIAAVAVIIERYLYFRRIGAGDGPDKVLGLVGEGRLEEALEIAQSSSLPTMKILAAGIGQQHNPTKAMEAEGIAELADLKGGLPILDTIVTLSPLLGLLGTILGMISSFKIMSFSEIGQPHAVTGGVAEALIATATGITVAVLALIPYNYFYRRVEREVEIIEHYACRLELALGAKTGRPAQ
ncbi:MAG TPA: MotA/TolQ/ExbB proton channel family protein [Patescibacteria group bacterium]|nr:MotA/TolQ/ExbB proton channel family protein [Patescibacteria group bacterium]